MKGMKFNKPKCRILPPGWSNAPDTSTDWERSGWRAALQTGMWGCGLAAGSIGVSVWACPTAVPAAGCCGALGTHPTAPASLKDTEAPGGWGGAVILPISPRARGWPKELVQSLLAVCPLLSRRAPGQPVPPSPASPSDAGAAPSW